MATLVGIPTSIEAGEGSGRKENLMHEIPEIPEIPKELTFHTIE